MSDTRTAQGTLWVCTDCAMAAVNGEMPTDPRPGEPEPWAREPETDVTPGAMGEDDDYQEFSWSDCDGCGSTLGGTRHAFTWWA